MLSTRVGRLLVPTSGRTVGMLCADFISGDTTVVCNGKWQVAVVDLGAWPTDFTGRPLGQLHNGKGWLQFCLVQGAESDPDNAIVASKNRWIKIITAS